MDARNRRAGLAGRLSIFCPLSADTGCGVIGKGLRAEGPLRMGGRRSSKRLIEINTTALCWRIVGRPKDPRPAPTDGLPSRRVYSEYGAGLRLRGGPPTAHFRRADRRLATLLEDFHDRQEPHSRSSGEDFVRGTVMEAQFMRGRYDQFVHDENIRRYKQQIANETDPSRLKVLQSLLGAEEGKSPDSDPRQPGATDGSASPPDSAGSKR